MVVAVVVVVVVVVMGLSSPARSPARSNLLKSSLRLKADPIRRFRKSRPIFSLRLSSTQRWQLTDAAAASVVVVEPKKTAPKEACSTYNLSKSQLSSEDVYRFVVVFPLGVRSFSLSLSQSFALVPMACRYTVVRCRRRTDSHRRDVSCCANVAHGKCM